MPTRVFLDWSTPLLPQLADGLLPEKGGGPLNLGDRLILAPTRQAGRRLREYLATEWRERGGTALLSLNVHPPSFLLQPEEPQPVAHAFDWMPAWQETLTGADPGTLPALLPQQREAFSPAVALEFGQRLQRLREELLDAGLDLSSVASSPLLLSEQERWRDLAELEEKYRQILKQQDLIDPVDAKRAQISTYTPRHPVTQIILAGVPDPSPVILNRLKQLESEVDIEVWIHAPEQEATAFTDWGQPESCWQERFPGRDKDPEGWIESFADPAALCQRLREWVRTFPEAPDLAFGLLDDRLELPVQHALQAEGKELYSPKPVKLAESPDVQLLSVLQEQRVQQDPVSLRAVWRHPALLKTLHPEDPAGLLRDWELFAAETFPENAERLPEQGMKDPLLSAFRKIKTWLSADSARGMRDLLKELHQDEELNPDLPADRYRLRQLHQLAEVLQEAARREESGSGPSAGVLLQVIKSENVDPPRVEGLFTAEGWLELSYHPAPSLLLAGFQEGKVPAVNPPDPFLPNQLREELGLRSDRDWLARDSYLFHSMILCRDPGRVRVWVMKRDREGSPLLPSRLLFACGEELLLRRAAYLFREAPPPALQAAPAPGLDLNPERLTPKTPERLSVSAIRDYLQCPSRFYFKHILGMRLQDDTRNDPDSGVFGSILHAVLKTVVDQGPCPLPEWNRRCEEALDRELQQRFGESGRMVLQVFRHAAVSRLRAAGPVQTALWEEGWRPLLTEQKLTRNCNGFTISGVLDRVDMHPERGFRIIDYKSHDNPGTPRDAHLGTPREGRESIQVQIGRSTRQWTDLQLPLYRWLAQSLPDLDPSRPLDVMYFNLPKAAGHTGLQIWEQEAELAEEALACLEAVTQLIHEEVWLPTSSPTPYDEYGALLHHGNDWIPKKD